MRRTGAAKIDTRSQSCGFTYSWTSGNDTRKVTVRITDGVGKGLDAKVQSTAVVSK